jgi:hypothetical protein
MSQALMTTKMTALIDRIVGRRKTKKNRSREMASGKNDASGAVRFAESG